MAATIRDVARAAGVSVTTASHSFTNNGRVASATRKRVQRVAEELGYTANVLAQRLANGSSQTVAVQISGAVSSRTQSLLPGSAFFLGVLNGAAEEAERRGYTLVLARSGVDEAGIQRLGLQGSIVVDPLGTEPVFAKFRREELPLVTIGRPVAMENPPPVVDNDHVKSTRHVLDHLRANGYRRVALLTTKNSRSYTIDVLRGLREWQADHGGEQIVVELSGQPSPKKAAHACKSLMSESHPPDALFATYDWIALGALHQARQDGISVPDQLGIVSSADSDALEWASVAITGLSLNTRQLGKRATQLLLQQIDGSTIQSDTVLVPTRLIKRQSSERTDSGTRRSADADEQRLG